jgi:glycosyltransferase involved in cell wall biosynthesis
MNLRRATLVVVVSDVLREEVVERGVPPDRVLVNPNGVDTDHYSPHIDGADVRRKYSLDGKLVIGFIGTFGAWHGAEVLADAFGDLIDKTPRYRAELRLLLIGDGERMPLVRDALRRHGVCSESILTGLIPQPEGPKHLAACDILVAPHVRNPDGSRFFGSPTKLFEYMAMGKAIVASALDQLSEVLEHHRSALLVEPGNTASLRKGLRELVESAELRSRLGLAARGDVVARHTWEQHTRRIIDRVMDLTR